MLTDGPFPDGVERLVPEGVTAGEIEGEAIPPLLLLHLSLGGQVSLSENWAKGGR